MGALESLLGWVTGLPSALVYVVVGAGAALENLFPPVPSDTFVLLGAYLAQRGLVEPLTVGVVAWVCNVGTALFVYGMARRYGRAIFETQWGHWLLRPHQLERLAGFYSRYGLVAIFGSRFLPVFRVVVPAFAGISGLRFGSAAAPLALASALWYGVLLYVGMLATRNLPRLLDMFAAVNNGLLVAAGVVLLAVGFWWWRTRQARTEEVGPEGDERAPAASGTERDGAEAAPEKTRGWWPEDPS